MKNNGDFIDFNIDFNSPIQWIQESEAARKEYQWRIFRTNVALQGEPSINLYEEEVQSNAKMLDTEQRKSYLESCAHLPIGKSFALAKAVDNRATQLSSGVDTYEYQVDDPYMIIDADTEDRLSAECQQDYVRSRLGQYASTFSRDLDRAGMCAAIIRYDKDDDINKIERVNPKNCWVDTMYSSTGKERFRGYSYMADYGKVLKMVEMNGDTINTNIEAPVSSILKDGKVYKSKVDKKGIETLNDLMIYIEDINKLACSPSLANSLADYDEYDHDLRSCYNLNWYQTYATDPKARTKNSYGGRDVEVTVMFDMKNKIEYTIINRRFVISANTKSFRRKINFDIINPYDNTIKTKQKEVKSGCPLVFQFSTPENRDLAPYPVSPVAKYLDIHDRLCALEAKREHVVKILSILRITTNAADARSLQKTLNIMGVVIPDQQGEVTPLMLSQGYDFGVLDSQIGKYELEIKQGLHAYDEFDALQMMGDRASAAESGMANGAIAQGLATQSDAVMGMYAEIARQCILNRVLYSEDDTFRVNNRGKFENLTIQALALNAVITVRSKMEKKVVQRTNSATAITLLGTFGDRLTENGQAYFIEQAMMGNVTRREAETFLMPPATSEQAIAANQQQAQNEAELLAQNQQMYLQNAVPYEANNTMQQFSSDEVDEIISGLATNSGGVEDVEVSEATAIAPQENAQIASVASPELMEMPGQPAGVPMNAIEGMTPEMAGQMANPASFAEV